MKVNWNVRSTTAVDKQVNKLSEQVQLQLRFLIMELTKNGPAAFSWPNYSKLKGKKNHDLRHCHLQKGKPTYICCWEVLDKKRKIIEVYYVGTHEKAPY